MISTSSVSAFDFDIALGAIRRITPLPEDLCDLRVLARGLLTDLCPEKTYPDELVDALVDAVVAHREAIRRCAAE